MAAVEAPATGVLADTKTTTVSILFQEGDDRLKHFILSEFPRRGATQSVGFHLYEASVLLSQFLARTYPSLAANRTKTCLELGAGSCALVGIVASHLGFKVAFTDLEEILPFLQVNVDRNAYKPDTQRVCELRWGEEPCPAMAPDHAPFDLIVGADTIYQEEALVPLLHTLARYTKREAWLCAEVRNVNLVEELFPQKAKDMGFTVKRIKQKQFPPPFCEDSHGSHLRIFKLTRSARSTTKGSGNAQAAGEEGEFSGNSNVQAAGEDNE